jgi:hypothetical protein
MLFRIGQDAGTDDNFVARVELVLDNLHAPTPYDPEEERAYAEHILRNQLEEWSQEDEQQPDDSFHYARAVGFDHHP